MMTNLHDTKFKDFTSDEQRKYAEDYMHSLQDKFERSSDGYMREANETQRGLSSQLILLSTVCITATIVALSNADLLSSMMPFTKTAIVFALIFEIISVVFGIAHWLQVERFYTKYARHKHDLVRYVATGKYESLKQLNSRVMKMQNDHSKGQPFEELGHQAVNTQIAFLGAALATIILIVWSIMVTPPLADINHHDASKGYHQRHEFYSR